MHKSKLQEKFRLPACWANCSLTVTFEQTEILLASEEVIRTAVTLVRQLGEGAGSQKAQFFFWIGTGRSSTLLCSSSLWRWENSVETILFSWKVTVSKNICFVVQFPGSSNKSKIHLGKTNRSYITLSQGNISRVFYLLYHTAVGHYIYSISEQ